jgi:hypothetical protein
MGCSLICPSGSRPNNPREIVRKKNSIIKNREAYFKAEKRRMEKQKVQKENEGKKQIF